MCTLQFNIRKSTECFIFLKWKWFMIWRPSLTAHWSRQTKYTYFNTNLGHIARVMFAFGCSFCLNICIYMSFISAKVLNRMNQPLVLQLNLNLTRDKSIFILLVAGRWLLLLVGNEIGNRWAISVFRKLWSAATIANCVIIFKCPLLAIVI